MKLIKSWGNVRNTGFTRLFSALLGTLLVQNIYAQGDQQAVLISPAVSAGAAQPATAASVEVGALLAKTPASALLAVDQNRASIIDTIVNFWQKDTSPNKEATVSAAEAVELRATLSSLRADHLLAASNARTLDGLRQIFAFADAGAAANKDGRSLTSKQKSLGNLVADTTYTPIAPCKLVDTRGTAGYYYAGGVFAASAKRTYSAYEGCLATVPRMAAVQLSVVTQYTGAGGGILSLMANGAPAPISNIFYAGYAPVTTTVPVNGSGTGGLFDAQISGVAGADLIIEVVGYFAAPTPTALDCAPLVSNSSTLPISFNGFQYTTASCPTGYTVVSAYCYNNGNPDVYSMGSGVNNGAFCSWRNLGTSPASVSNGAHCCRVPGR